MATATAYVRSVVLTTLSTIPIGSLLYIRYEPKEEVSASVFAAAKLLDMDPFDYFVEITSYRETKGKEVILCGRCLNRGGQYRSFALLGGKLHDIKILRIGPGPNAVTVDGVVPTETLKTPSGATA